MFKDSTHNKVNSEIRLSEVFYFKVLRHYRFLRILEGWGAGERPGVLLGLFFFFIVTTTK